MDTMSLFDGEKTPLLGLGTYAIDRLNIEPIIIEALRIGYRKFDCAWSYQNEELIGDAIRKSGIDRRDIFLTTKLHVKDIRFGLYNQGILFKKKSVKKSVEEACKRLQTDYIDMYLLHWPWRGFLDMWEEMIEIQKEGLVRSIGATGFLPEHVEVLKKNFDILPAVNQFEFHPYNSNYKLLDYCRKNNIVLEGFTPFATGPYRSDRIKDFRKDETLKSIAEKYQKTPHQIILRWLIQQGIPVIARTNNKEHLMKNFSIFDFNICKEEIEYIDSLNQDIYTWANPFDTLKYLSKARG